jgi:hypothetical protein
MTDTVEEIFGWLLIITVITLFILTLQWYLSLPVCYVSISGETTTCIQDGKQCDACLDGSYTTIYVR